MKTLKAFVAGDGSKWGLTDWYEEKQKALVRAIKRGKPFDTGWYASKKEIASGRVYCDGKLITVEASVTDDFDTPGRAQVSFKRPFSLKKTIAAMEAAYDMARQDRKNNQVYRGYSILKNGVWVETYLVNCSEYDTPPGDFYYFWGWQSGEHTDGAKPDPALRIPAKTRKAFEAFAHSMKDGSLQMAKWEIHNWDDE